MDIVAPNHHVTSCRPLAAARSKLCRELERVIEGKFIVKNLQLMGGVRQTSSGVLRTGWARGAGALNTRLSIVVGVVRLDRRPIHFNAHTMIQPNFVS